MKVNSVNSYDNIRIKNAIKKASIALVFGVGVMAASRVLSPSKAKPVDDNYNTELKDNKEYNLDYITSAKSVTELVNRLNVIQANKERKETFWDKKLKESIEEK